jgi:hypothetical protein
MRSLMDLVSKESHRSLYYVIIIADGSLLNAEQLYVLAQLCIDFMYELHEFYAEVINNSIDGSYLY